MRIYDSDAQGNPTCIRIWANVGAANAAFYTIPDQGFGDALEIPMTIGGQKGVVENPPRHAVLWTQHASGGCTPFGVFVRNPGTDQTLAFGLAHLGFSPEDEAKSFGQRLQGFANQVNNVYLVVIKMPRYIEGPEPRNYFTAFEAGFGTAVRGNQNKVLVRATSPTGAITSDGYYGELTHADVDALTGRRSPAGQSGKKKACILM